MSRLFVGCASGAMALSLVLSVLSATGVAPVASAAPAGPPPGLTKPVGGTPIHAQHTVSTVVDAAAVAFRPSAVTWPQATAGQPVPGSPVWAAASGVRIVVA